MPDDISGVLNAAADYLSIPGHWGTQEFVQGDGCRCALGAITWAVDPTDNDGDPTRSKPVAAAAARAFAEYVADDLDASRYVTGNDEDQPYELDVIETVGYWNDTQSGPEPVVTALRDCAAKTVTT